MLKCIWKNFYFFTKNRPWRDDSNDMLAMLHFPIRKIFLEIFDFKPLSFTISGGSTPIFFQSNSWSQKHGGFLSNLTSFYAISMATQQLGNLPPLCKNIAGGWTQNAISILFAKYRLVSEVIGMWFLRRASYNFVRNFLLISVKEWYRCQLLIFSSDNIICWSKFTNFDMRVGCQKLSAMLNLRLMEYWKI